jgi:hypothetical protein
MVDVVREPQGDTARVCSPQCSSDDGDEVFGQVQVVDRDVQRTLRRSEEVGERVRSVGGRLAAVGQRADFDRLYSRLAAW